MGSEFLVLKVTDVQPGRHVSGVAPEEMAKVFDPMSATYAVLPAEAGGSRSPEVMGLAATPPDGPDTVYADLLLWMRPDRTKLAEFDDRWTRGGTGSSAQHSLPG